MTTTVTVKHDGPDHHDVLVETFNPTTKEGISAKQLAAGESVTFYVHSGSEILVTETAKITE